MNRVEIPLSKAKVVLMLVGALIFVIAGVFFIIDPEMFLRPPYHKVVMVRTVGVAAVLFFGAAAFFVIRKMGDKRPGLIVDEQGIYDNTSGTSIGLIRWEDITEIETKDISSTKVLLIHVSNPDAYLDKVSGFKRKAMQMNYNMYGTPLSITANTLKYKFNALEQLLQEGLSSKANNGRG